MTLRASAGIVAGGQAVYSSYATAIRSTTTSTTLVATDHTVLVDATAAAATVTLPTAATSVGRIYVVKKLDSSANAVTIQGNGAEVIDGTNTKVISTQFTAIMLQSNGTAWFVLSAN